MTDPGTDRDTDRDRAVPPEGLPLFDGPDFKADSPARFAELRRRAPLHRGRFLGGFTGWVVVDPALAREALNHPALVKDPVRAGLVSAEDYARDVLFAGNMLTADPPDHTRLRKLVAGAFTPRSAVRLRPRIQEICDGLLDGIAPLGETDLVESYTRVLPMAVISELLGVPEDRRAEFQHWSNEALGNEPGTDTREGMARLRRYLAELLEEKRREPAEDLFSALIRVRDEEDGRLSDEELLGTGALLVIAGHETTVNLLGSALEALLRDPAQADLLRADPGLLPGAVEEFLRRDAPVEYTPGRFAAEDLRLGGEPIRRGESVTIALGSANHGASPGDGTGLDVTRGDARHLSFGHGIHYCLGAPLARAEGEIGLRSVLERLPDLELADPERSTPWISAGLMRGPTSLPVRFTPR
ncbi:cytochrome P450 family protein [Nocardiopsis potens]|uniref:cytochrome P450 family protein n=1 Tax=Nocardiopsis potens TaxID=1246458 RepID=UPI000347EFAA|nr:cytochrome P450 [Nocardiopsis potens]